MAHIFSTLDTQIFTLKENDLTVEVLVITSPTIEEGHIHLTIYLKVQEEATWMQEDPNLLITLFVEILKSR